MYLCRMLRVCVCVCVRVCVYALYGADIVNYLDARSGGTRGRL